MFDNKMIDALRRLSGTIGLCGVVLLGSACADNVFDGPGGGSADQPEITALTGPATASAGETLRLEVAATGQLPIETINVSLQAGTTVRDTTITLASPALAIEEVLLIPLSATLPGTSLVVTVTVVDDSGTESEPSTLTLEIEDSAVPIVEIRRPVGPEGTVSGDTAAVGLGATLRVEAHVTDESGISEVRFIGFAFRGDAELGTDVTVTRFEERVVTFPRQGVDTLPTDTIIRRDLPQVGDSVETVFIIVTATDLFGNVSADTVPVIVGGPDVRIIRPDDEAVHSTLTDLTIRITIDDASGIESATLELSGILQESIPLLVPGVPTVDTVTYVLTAVRLAGATGTLVISATSRNVRGVTAPAAPVTVFVVAQTLDDQTDPTVSYTISPLPRLTQPLPRVEMLDTISITASADDQGGAGVTQIGIIVDAVLNSGASVAQLGFTQNYATPRSNPDTTVAIAVKDLYDDVSATLAASVDLPDSIDLRVRAFAFDGNGNSDTATVATGANSERGLLLTVAGFTARLPGRGIISDAVIDTAFGNERLFLSNFSQSRVDVLELRDSTFLPDGVLTGAQPWGLFIDLSSDTLIVANSGGTNLSKVPLRLATLAEDPTARVHTPETVIYQFTRELDAQLNPRFSVVFTGYSDRPQFVAQGISTALLYSTVPTQSAPDGTIRMAVKDQAAGWLAYETYFLFPGGDPADETAAESFLILNADRVLIAATDSGDLIRIVDHVPGFPASTIDVTGTESTVFTQAWAAGSDVVKCAGSLNNEAVAVQDTTFVAASGDRRWIAFGEGATAGAGRIIMFDGSNTEPLDPGCLASGQSHEMEILDLIDNASETVTGLGLNANGTLGVARGDFAAYYFDRALRLEGSFEEDITPGGFGAALHPLLATESAGSSAETLSFVGTAESTIRIIDTFHFFARGDVPIRDPIVGPLRVTLPLDGDNGGLVCPGDPACVVVKLFGVTQSAGAERPDGVVIVDVRERDID
ncbi:MAG TPA: hypothetical protein VMN78_07370 [Longimicrobiales bacterium]|nr:hypothetical protein [Longimicrobiales bacterium]